MGTIVAHLSGMDANCCRINVLPSRSAKIKPFVFCCSFRRAYHGSLVVGNPGFEHIIVFGGTKPTGAVMDHLGVITLNGEPPSQLVYYVAVACASVFGPLLLVIAWRLVKRLQRRRIIRRWQTAYLMIRAHLETKKRLAEEIANRSDDGDDVRASSAVQYIGTVSSAKKIAARHRKNRVRAM